MLAEPVHRPGVEVCDLTERRSALGASEAFAGPTRVELVAALDRAWQEIRRRHEEVPPVVLLVGPSPPVHGREEGPLAISRLSDGLRDQTI